MTEPAAQSIAAGVSAALLAWLGVPLHAIIWGGVGAIAIMVFTPPEARTDALLSVIVGALVGAGLGHGLATLGARLMEALATPATGVLASLVCGAGAKMLLTAAIERVRGLIDTWGGRR